MPSLAKAACGLWLVACGLPAQRLFFQVSGNAAQSWPPILSAIGFQPQAPGGQAEIFVLGPAAAGAAEGWLARADSGAVLILEGDSSVARALGFLPGAARVQVQNAPDLRRPRLPVIWETAAELPVFTLPDRARVFARERWTAAPLMAGFRRGAGAVLWVATTPGSRGYERFPFLPQALVELGLNPPFQSRRLWAFLDSSYRSRVDLEYFAARWRASGIAALHVAAWHFYDPDPEKTEYLRRLIATCRRHGILVYAWLELPHVSERFWNDHPEWREKTALLQDAQLDWRKLMNLANRDCFAAAAAGVHRLLEAFDWDGINLAELYFESLEGAANPSRFTPMNDDVRRDFRQARGFDPLELFQPGVRNGERLRDFLNYRASLAGRMQREWIAEVDRLRGNRPHLDLVLTHVDDRFDTSMRDAVGADAARVLPLLEQHDFTFLVEDPATVWHLGPQRYPEIARHYRPLTRHTDRLGIDINVVERYQDVYPTRQQTGTELFQMLHLASDAFPRVTLYFENSLDPADLPLLPAAAAAVTRVARFGNSVAVDSHSGIGVRWQGPALVDGRLWPAADGSVVWLPAGAHVVETAARQPIARLLDFNGELLSAASLPDGLEFAYRNSARALALLDRRPARVQIDDTPASPPLEPSGEAYLLVLPRGQHVVRMSL